MAGPGFTRSHRGGEGPPMVCLHGFTDTWRTWELVLPQLEGRHEVVAPTVPGHAGGPAIEGEVSDEALVEQVETILKPRGHRARPPGGQLAGRLRCPAPRRARAGESVVALAPAGGWAADDDSYKDTLRYFLQMQKLVADAAPHADAIASSPDGRRQATRDIVTNFEHIPPELIAHVIRGAAACSAAEPLIEYALREGWSLEAEAVDCPVRIVWGADDRILAWPKAAARFRKDWLPQADWVELDGVGHCPQLDVPVETAELIVGFTAR